MVHLIFLISFFFCGFLHPFSPFSKEKRDIFTPPIEYDSFSNEGIIDRGVGDSMHFILSNQYNYPELTDRRVSISLKDVDVVDAIEFIGKSSGISFILDRDVKGTINSISFDNAPLSAVLKQILTNNSPSLALIRDSGVFRVTLQNNARNIFLERGDNGFDFAAVPLMFFGLGKKHKTKIETVWKSILGENFGKPGFYLVMDEDSKKILCRGKVHHILQFKRFLQEIDWRMPQVKIEARFVCAEKGFEENIGFKYSGIYNRKSSVKKGFDFVQAGSSKNIVDWALNFLPTPGKVVKGIALPFIFGGKSLGTRRLNLILNAAENRNEIKTILKPTVLTNDGDIAEILVGENVPIESNVEELIDGRVRNRRTAKYKDIGIQLRVKPVVSPDKKSIYLDIYIENSQKTDSVRSGKTSYPVIRTTRSHTKVRLSSGQTTMISGLIKDIKEFYGTRAPLLSKIPIIGWFFRGSRRVSKDMQLLIFITSTVI